MSDDVKVTVEGDDKVTVQVGSDALEGHRVDTTNVHGIADTTALATDADVQAAIDALLDAAPTALDTLNELAAALGDDPNFAATVTAAIDEQLTEAEADALYRRLDTLIAVGQLDGTGATAGEIPIVQGDGTVAWGIPTAVTTVEEATAARTLVLADAGKIIEATAAAETTVTVPPNADVAFPVGTIIGVYAAGAGGVVIAAGTGVTIRNRTDVLQYEETSLRKRAADEWVQV